jgi:hypothetical protein
VLIPVVDVVAVPLLATAVETWTLRREPWFVPVLVEGLRFADAQRLIEGVVDEFNESLLLRRVDELDDVLGTPQLDPFAAQVGDLVAVDVARLVIEDNEVVNVVLWDGENDWQPPEGSTAALVEEEDKSLPEVAVIERQRGKPDVTEITQVARSLVTREVGPGWRYENGEFVRPEQPEPPE